MSLYTIVLGEGDRHSRPDYVIIQWNFINTGHRYYKHEIILDNHGGVLLSEGSMVQALMDLNHEDMSLLDRGVLYWERLLYVYRRYIMVRVN